MLDAKIKEKIAFTMLFLATVVVIAPVALILFVIFVNGVQAINAEFLFGYPSDGMRAGGIFPAIVGTIYLIFGTAIFSIPFGVMAAIYLNEYAKKSWLTRVIEM